MALEPQISYLAAKAALDNLLDLVDGGASFGYIEIRDGTKPTNCETASAGTLAATLTMSDPAFLAATDQNPNARAAADTISDDTSADATTTVTYFRVFDSNAVCIMQGTVGTSGADMNFNSVAFQSGANVSISSFLVTMPES